MTAPQGDSAGMRPLDDILVVSLEQAVSAPYCTRLLGDQGARVIKVERPDGGDFARNYDTRIHGESSYFIWGNRSKESRTLDLKTPEALATIYPYGPFKTSDGQVLFGFQNDREWKAFCEQVLERPDMALDPRFVGNSGRADHRDVIAGVIGDVLPKLTTTEALSRLDKAGIGTAEVRDMAGLWAHPQPAARGRWQQIDTPAGALPALTPTSGQGWQPQMAPVPGLGEHTQQILKEFGLGAAPNAATPKTGA